jgi:tricorn protease
MTSYDRPVTRSLYVALLADDVPSPFLPRSDEEEGPDEGGAEADEEEEAEATGASLPDVTVRIDFDGIARRIVDAPDLPARDYTGLVPGPEGTVFVRQARPDGGPVLHKYTVADAEAAEFATGVTFATTSHDRGRILLRSGNDWRIVDTDRAPSENEGRLDLGDLRVRVEPRAEYAQMLRDGWRFMRDFLYVDNQHGAPWDEVWSWYAAWLPDVEHRADFNHLLDMVSGEIAVGHSYVRGGDYPDLDDARAGLLGVDLVPVGDRYRISRV